jgi:hypothetical protein
MKKLVLLVVVLALCVPVFAAAPATAVLVYDVKVSGKTLNYAGQDVADGNYVDATFDSAKLKGYVIGKFNQVTLDVVDEDASDYQICILVDTKAKTYTVIDDANDYVELTFDGRDLDGGEDTIFNKISNSGKDKGDYIMAEIYVSFGNSDMYFGFDGWDGLEKLTSTTIAGGTKIPAPKSINFDGASAWMGIHVGDIVGETYTGKASCKVNSKYTKGANNTVKTTALMIIADLEDKKYLLKSHTGFFAD